jgi:hypothetical protein
MSPRKSYTTQTDTPESPIRARINGNASPPTPPSQYASRNRRAENLQTVENSPRRITRSTATLPAASDASTTPFASQFTRRSQSSSVSPYSQAPPSPIQTCYHVAEINLLTQQRKTISERNDRLNSDNSHLRTVNKLLCSRIKVLDSKCRQTTALMKCEEDEFYAKQKCSVAFHDRYLQSYRQKCKSLKEVINHCYDLLGVMEQNG